jgi:hypothetical protein
MVCYAVIAYNNTGSTKFVQKDAFYVKVKEENP